LEGAAAILSSKRTRSYSKAKVPLTLKEKEVGSNYTEEKMGDFRHMKEKLLC